MKKHININHKTEEEIVKELWTKKKEEVRHEAASEEEKEEETRSIELTAEGNVYMFATLAILVGAVLFFAGFYTAYSLTSNVRPLSTIIHKIQEEQKKADKNNAIIRRAVEDNKLIEQRQKQYASGAASEVYKLLSPNSVTIK